MDVKVFPLTLISAARETHSAAEIADEVGVSRSTVHRWLSGNSQPHPAALRLLESLVIGNVPSVADGNEGNVGFRFIDLFAGIGGMRLGFEPHGGRCVLTSEWDAYAQKTYRENFLLDHPLVGDIRNVSVDRVPAHDVLLAGFPCQPFSIAGVSKKNSLGREHGFDCTTQGTLFFEIERILRDSRPGAFLLENVKNLKSHDKGRTFSVIMRSLQDLGYEVHYKVIDANGFVPQHRERVFIVGFREPTDFTWDALKLPQPGSVVMSDILHADKDYDEVAEPPYTKKTRSGRVVVNRDKYTLSDKLWRYLRDYAEKHRKAGNGFGYGMVSRHETSRTLSARYYKDGSEILVSQGKDNPRRLTPRECARLMGYDSGERRFRIPVSDTRAYQQFGNGVCVPVVSEIARIMTPHVRRLAGVAVRERSRQMSMFSG